MGFNEVIESLKAYLKENLTPENTNLLSHIDKDLDKAVDAHKATEKELASVKDKLVDVVKETSFKTESKDADPNKVEEEDKPLGINEAFDEAFKEIKEARKGGN